MENKLELRKIVKKFNRYIVLKLDEKKGWRSRGKSYDVKGLDSLLKENWDKENQIPIRFRFRGNVEIAKDIKEYNEFRKIEENLAKKEDLYIRLENKKESSPKRDKVYDILQPITSKLIMI